MGIQSIQTNFISQISHSLHFFYIGKKPSEFSKIIFFPTYNIPNILEYASNRIVSFNRNISEKFVSSKNGIRFGSIKKLICGFSRIFRHLFSKRQYFKRNFLYKVVHLNLLTDCEFLYMKTLLDSVQSSKITEFFFSLFNSKNFSKITEFLFSLSCKHLPNKHE